ncbi:MAG: OmpA family protein [Rikenellaceae bacterium]|nr:OmpA family protein [Rikenellaceae bacterium]
MTKKITLLFVALCCSISLFAQGTEGDVKYRQQSKTDETVEFRPHWDLQLQGGAAYTLSESSSLVDYLSPAAYLSTTYKFHPAMGVRFGVGGWQAKGVVVIPEKDYKFNFVQAHADYKLDLNSLFGGFNHRRVCSVYAFVGIGYNYAFNNDDAVAIAAAAKDYSAELEYLWKDSRSSLVGRAGLGLDFRVGDYVSLNLEGNANMLSDHFNSKHASHCDWQFNLLAGVSVRFGKNHQPSQAYADRVAAEEAARLAAERLAAEKAAAEKAEAERLAAEAAAAAERDANAKAAKELADLKRTIERNANIAAHSNNVYFTIGSAKVREVEAAKVKALVKFLNENPDYRVAVVGYADKFTGNADINMVLSEKRAAAVRKQLIEAGIAESRIDSEYKGETGHFGENPDDNRVVICTLE